MIKICNLRHEGRCCSWDFRVDRRSPVGNPFAMKDQSIEGRDRVCDEYKIYFDQRLKEDSAMSSFRVYLDNLLYTYKKYGKLRLFCWCAPKRCHAETIKDWLNETIKT